MGCCWSELLPPVSLLLWCRLTSDTFCLDLRSLAWTRLQPSSEKLLTTSNLNMPRASHVAVPLPSDGALLLIGEQSSTSRQMPSASLLL